VPHPPGARPGNDSTARGAAANQCTFHRRPVRLRSPQARPYSVGGPEGGQSGWQSAEADGAVFVCEALRTSEPRPSTHRSPGPAMLKPHMFRHATSAVSRRDKCGCDPQRVQFRTMTNAAGIATGAGEGLVRGAFVVSGGRHRRKRGGWVRRGRGFQPRLVRSSIGVPAVSPGRRLGGFSRAARSAWPRNSGNTRRDGSREGLRRTTLPLDPPPAGREGGRSPPPPSWRVEGALPRCRSALPPVAWHRLAARWLQRDSLRTQQGRPF